MRTKKHRPVGGVFCRLIDFPSCVQNIIGGEEHQVLAGDVLHLGEAVILGHDDVLQNIADTTGVTEALGIKNNLTGEGIKKYSDTIKID